MKTLLLLATALLLSVLACDTLAPDCVRPEQPKAVAVLHADKPPATPRSPAKPSTPAKTPTARERTSRPVPPAHLFM
jgi:hypothetical protein